MSDADDATHRTRAAYDAVAEDYAAQFVEELESKPLDRALLGALVEQVRPKGIIADVGCGPGHVAAWLREHGADAVGMDLSQRMIELARKAFPGSVFQVADVRSLPVGDGEWAAAVAFYSLIHLPPGDLPVAFAELHRVLEPGARLMLAFHCGSEIVHRDEWFGHSVSIDFHLLEIDAVEEALAAAGFSLEATLERINYPHEHPTRRAYLIARKGD